MERDALLTEIARYAESVGLLPSTVCARAVNNGHLFKRLQNGGDCSTSVMARVRAYMRENPPQSVDEKGAA